jgi:hypothetical protein
MAQVENTTQDHLFFFFLNASFYINLQETFTDTVSKNSDGFDTSYLLPSTLPDYRKSFIFVISTAPFFEMPESLAKRANQQATPAI